MIAPDQTKGKASPKSDEHERRERNELLLQNPRRFTAGTGRLKTNVWPMVQTSVAASVAYFLATVVLDSEQPFFAPIAATISLGLTLGQRGRRTVEVVLGVVIGLLIADLVVSFIGVGPV